MLSPRPSSAATREGEVRQIRTGVHRTLHRDIGASTPSHAEKTCKLNSEIPSPASTRERARVRAPTELRQRCAGGQTSAHFPALKWRGRADICCAGRAENSHTVPCLYRLTERAGKVQVQVRTQDHELTKSLQGNLGDLVGRLENKGFKAEAWIPSTARHVQSAASPTANPGSGNSDSSGSPAREQQQQQQRHSGNGRQRSRWNAQLNDTLSEETRSNVQ